jgi:integration host factor subunit alpha
MADETVTRADLSEAVYQEVGLSRNESADLVESVLSEIADTLTRGEAVKISSFGSFSVRQKGQRVGRNPKTGEEVPILPRKVLVFRASNVLKNRINGGAGDLERLTGYHSDSTPLQQQETSPLATDRAPLGSGS